MRRTGPNDSLMLMFGTAVVLAWVVIAASASYYSLVEQRDISDSQLTVIGLLGGPALLIITSVLDLFKGKESAKIGILPDELASEVAATESHKNHTRTMQELRLKHDLEMEALRQKHDLKMDDFVTTSGGSDSSELKKIVPKRGKDR